MSRYIVTTANTAGTIITMNSYAGTSLIYTDAAFLVWIWTDPHSIDINTATTTISAIGVIFLNV